ncbi:hypothetical protein JL722_11907 [Aureococcus anophagefferens]|nr:hypothetical protein JL722_11907 [Aureococcus anophagefferens]
MRWPSVRALRRVATRRSSSDAQHVKTIKYFAAANVAAVGCLGAAVALRPDADDGADARRIVARFEALGRGARLASTLAVVAADYKRAELFDRGPSSAVEAAAAALRSAQDAQEKSGLQVERATTAAERRAGLEAAAAAREAVLAASEAVATAALVSRAFAAMTFSGGCVHCDPHAANVLVRRGPRGAPELVILDHGLYRDLDASFRLEYARLWRALATADTRGIKASAQRLGVGDLYPLFAAMLTQRPWDDVANPDMNSLRSNGAADNAMLQAYAERYAKEITLVLDRVPRQMLLLLKMSDCLRHLDRGRGDNNTHAHGHACADALFAEDRDVRAWLNLKLRLWAHDALEAWRGRAAYDPMAQVRAKVHVPDQTSGFAKDDRGHLFGAQLVNK